MNNDLSRIEKFLLISMNLLFVAALVYALYDATLPLKSFVSNSLLAGIPFLILGAIAVWTSLDQYKVKNILWFILGFPILTVIAIVGGSFFFSLGYSLKEWYPQFYDWLRCSSASNIWKFLSICGLTFLVGLTCFHFKTKLRVTYGFTECLVALIATIISLPDEKDNTTDSKFYMAILTGSVYLFVTGFENIKDGLENKNDRLVQCLINYIKRKSRKH